jgi:hypothetical protein
MSELWPGDMAPETYNSQYLQRHATSAPAVLASARAAHVLSVPLEQIEDTVFTMLGTDVSLNVKAWLISSDMLFSANYTAFADRARSA